jgi:outer membrane receptor protein involved in Fe transport
VTKSGGNQIHGDAFEFVRNTSLDSRNFYAYDLTSLSGADIPGSAIGAFHWNQDNLRILSAADDGTFSFNGTETGFDFADFLIGAPFGYNQSMGGALDQRAPYLGLYTQDTWQAKPSLTLNYGLRWELTPFWHDTENRLIGMVPGKQSVVFPDAPTGIVFPGDPGIPDTIAPTHYTNFAPRIGLAYSPDAQGGFLGKLFGGPGINNFDMAMVKDVHLTESMALEIRGEFFNTFNHAQFLTPNGNISAGPSAFGFVTNAANPRIGQLAAKFLF